jgi:hypothetical protein
MRKMTRSAERAAWLEHFTGEKAKPTNKYNVAPKEQRGGYASKHEMEVAANLHALARAGKIQDLQEQVRIVLVEGDETERGITFIADFTFQENGVLRVLDAKGVKTKVYLLKKKLLWHLKRIRVEEV